MLIMIFFSCMVITNSTNKNRLPSYLRFLKNNYQRNSQKIHSLVYKNYTLVEYEDGTKSYVSPGEKERLILKTKFKSSKLSLEDERHKEVARDFESESDSGYEIPMTREKPKSSDDLDKAPKTEIKRSSSFPFSEGEIFPGDNGRINLPPYIIPLETSLTLPMSRQKQKARKNRRNKNFNAEHVEKNMISLSLDEVYAKNRFSFKDTFWEKNKKKSSGTNESPLDVEVRKIRENNVFKSFSMLWKRDIEGNKKPLKPLKTMKFGTAAIDRSDIRENSDKEKEEREIVGDLQLKDPVEILLKNNGAKENGGTKRFSHGFYFPKFSDEPLKYRERRWRNEKFDPNPLKKMFGIRGLRKGEGKEEEGTFCKALDSNSERESQDEEVQRRYSDAILSEIRSDTESADHGSADKSSVSKLTSEKQSKKLVSGLFGSFRKGRNKERMSVNDAAKNSLSFEIAVKEPPVDIEQTDDTRAEGIVYAELDMGRFPCSVMRRDDEKTEYAEIIYPGTKPTIERPLEDLRRSQENLTSSRENLGEVDESFSTMAGGKKEASV